ncbi:MAG TPA: hypothetical protein VEF71_10650 [Streptosporangiaceae bacterium]|nr:hypothetical protein [Streptosporangiaceae bacterium]
MIRGEHPSTTRAAVPGAPGQPRKTGRPRAAAGRLARGYAFVVVSLRYLIIGGWMVVVAAAIAFLPSLNASTGGLSELIPPGSRRLMRRATPRSDSGQRHSPG